MQKVKASLCWRDELGKEVVARGPEVESATDGTCRFQIRISDGPKFGREFIQHALTPRWDIWSTGQHQR